MDPQIVKKTQDTLGKIIKKPPLTDKLLGKPPFRFLHDVMTSVIKTTGFMKGLYTESEMNSENVKEKEAKIAFLQKAVDMVVAVTGRNLAVKPMKVVAGHEPELTNEFLQALAAAINAKVDNDEYVKKVLSGGGGGGGGSAGKEEKKERDKERTRSASRRKDGEEKHRKEDKERSRDRDKDKEKERRERHKDRDGDGDGEKEKDRHRDRDRREKSRDREERHRDKDRDKERDRDRDKDRDREKDKDKDRDRDRRRRAKESKVLGIDKDAPNVESDRKECPEAAEGSVQQADKISDKGLLSPRKKASAEGRRGSTQTQHTVSPGTDALNNRRHRDPRKKAKAAPVVKHTSSPSVSSDMSKSSPHRSLKTHTSSPTIMLNSLPEETESGGSEAVGASSVVDPAGGVAPIAHTKSKDTGKASVTKTRLSDAAADGAAGDSHERASQDMLHVDSPASSSLETAASEDLQKAFLSRCQADLSKPKPYHKAPPDVRITEPPQRSTAAQAKQPKPDKPKSEKSVSLKPSRARGEKGAGRQAKPSPSKVNLQSDTSPMQTRSTQQKKVKHKEEKENESPEQNGEKETSQEAPSRLQRPTSAKGSRRRRQGRDAREDEDEEFQQRGAGENHEPTIGEDDLPPQIAAARKMARPPSARPAPPRPKQDGVEAEPSMRLGTGAPTNLIVDNEKQSDDEDENFLVEESAPPPPPPEPVSTQADAEDDAEHGALVKKMLESKKEAEQQQQQPTKKTEIERPAMSDAQRRKQREMVAKEIERLQTSIQSLTRSANPLGKIMDYVQEDLDSMQKELDRWRAENKEHALALRRERNVTDRAIEPLKAQLADLDRAITDQLDLIAATKSNIIRNDQKASKMLQSLARS